MWEPQGQHGNDAGTTGTVGTMGDDAETTGTTGTMLSPWETIEMMRG